MASSKIGIKHEYRGSERNHPVDAGHLLAIIRDQHLDNEAIVRRHLVECEQCRQSYAELMRTSRTLDALEQMARYQCYPEVSPAQILVKARQSAAQQRSSSYRLPARGVSLPVAVILIIMTIAIVVALALAQIGKFPSPWHLPGGGALITANPALITEVKQHVLSPAANSTQKTTDSPLTGSGPYLQACTSTGDKRDQITAICGYHFPPGEKITLYVSINPAGRWRERLNPRVSVDGSGKFIYNWRSNLCNFDAVTIYAVDRTSDPLIDVAIYNVSPPGCPVPDSTATRG